MSFDKLDTRIKQVVQLLDGNRYPIPANVEYEYGTPGMHAVRGSQKVLRVL
jgi:hypothetical protein